MTTDLHGPEPLPDGILLPAPRPFGETNTLTLSHRPRQLRSQGGVVALAAVVDDRHEVLRAGIMRVEAAALTVTF